MTSRELHAWVEKQGVPAKWQLPVVQLLRGLLEEEREWPTIPWRHRHAIALQTFCALNFKWFHVNLFGDCTVIMYVPSDRGPASQHIPLGADWVREVVRLAPKKRPASEVIMPWEEPNEKPAPEVVGGYKETPSRVTLLQAPHGTTWATVFIESGQLVTTGNSIQHHRLRFTCDLSKLGVEQAIIDLHELGDKPVALVVGAIAAGNWSWIFENRDLLAHHGIDLAACVKDPSLGMDEWLLRGQRHEIYSEGT